MAVPSPEVMDRKLAYLRRFLADLGEYARLDEEGRRREHYAIERLIQLLCESAADIGLQLLKARGESLPGSYREVFAALTDGDGLAADLRDQLVAACGMRNVLTHIYDAIDLDLVIAAVDPAIALYQGFATWAAARVAALAGARSGLGEGVDEGGPAPA
jgi:uncharacterized protein YutE (UPF0331/DUF86 family)